MRYCILWLLLVASLLSCSRYDAARIVRAAATGNPTVAAKALARDKAIGYASNPKALATDLKQFTQLLKAFIASIESVWGTENVRLPRPKQYVKYTHNYLSRASVNFDTGIIEVETMEQKTPLASLKNAIVTTLLTPGDPRAVDLYSDKAVALGGPPFLFGEVKDHENQNIRWGWRAERYADYLLRNRLKTHVIDGKNAHSVSFRMVRDHLDIRAGKYKALVENASRRFGVSRNLIFAIMKVESDFNPFAVSSAMAIGLMQVVPDTAGSDVYRLLHNKKGTPSRKYLLQPPNNITYGTAYLHLLDARYLAGVTDPVAREYCIISGYNGGAGSVLRTFGKDKKQAIATINSTPPASVFKTLRHTHPYKETRRYLGKVLDAKKHFVNF